MPKIQPSPPKAQAPRTTADDLLSLFPRMQQHKKAMSLAMRIARVIQGENEEVVREAMNLCCPKPIEKPQSPPAPANGEPTPTASQTHAPLVS